MTHLPATDRDPRLFVALQPPAELAQELHARARPVLEGLPGLRLYPPRDLHLTLLFLGPYPAGDLQRLQADLKEQFHGLSEARLSIEGTGAFPDRRRPRVLWAGIREQRGSPLVLLHRRAALAAGVASPRHFHPHLTLARLRPGRPLPAAFDGLELRLPWDAREVVLFESRPERPGERYRPLLRLPLAPLKSRP